MRRSAMIASLASTPRPRWFRNRALLYCPLNRSTDADQQTSPKRAARFSFFGKFHSSPFSTAVCCSTRSPAALHLHCTVSSAEMPSTLGELLTATVHAHSPRATAARRQQHIKLKFRAPHAGGAVAIDSQLHRLRPAVGRLLERTRCRNECQSLCCNLDSSRLPLG